jgi:uncharacterized protein DUF4115
MNGGEPSAVPETKTDWILFILGLLALAGLILAIALGDARAPTSGSPKSAHTAVPVETVSTPNTTTKAAVTTTYSSPTSTAIAPTTELRLRAVRDTWLAVRPAATGSTVYEGILQAGETKSFTGTAFWVRFGAASNVFATLNGKRLSLPGGTYSVPITAAGLGGRTA